MNTAAWIAEGNGIVGIEFGTTRIKAVLIGGDHAPLAAGAHKWENRLEDGYWTYHAEDIWHGIQDAYADLKQDVYHRYGVKLTKLAGFGVSAMMHGYIPFDKEGKQLAGFRTWRNATTGAAAKELTELFHFNIPLRWTIAHLYQAILNGEDHVKDIAFLTTLEGYVHWKLTGCRVVGVGEGAGIVPTDPSTNDYDRTMVAAFDRLVEPYGYPWKLLDILPEVLNAGDDAGCLTAEGALLLDPTGETQSGIPFCPPEGDAGTGMVATNSIAPRTANISAGTSIFIMAVLEKSLSKVYPEIDMVTTPTGTPVAMVHASNCTSDINAWVNMIKEAMEAMGQPCDLGLLYETLFRSAMKGDPDCGGVVNCGYFSGETITDVDEGRPMMIRMPTGLSFANFARSLVFGAMATLKIGMRILDDEQVRIDTLTGHGGFFKTPGTAQKLLASAIGTPVSAMETAGEGGAWGMALLAAYMAWRAEGETLEDYLSHHVFADARRVTEQPDAADAAGFARYMERFEAILPLERDAVKAMR